MGGTVCNCGWYINIWMSILMLSWGRVFFKVVPLYSNTDTATAQKNSHFISSERSNLYIYIFSYMCVCVCVCVCMHVINIWVALYVIVGGALIYECQYISNKNSTKSFYISFYLSKFFSCVLSIYFIFEFLITSLFVILTWWSLT